MIYHMKAQLSNGELAAITVDTDDIDEWVDEVWISGIHGEKLYIPPASITYISVEEDVEETATIDTIEAIED